MTEPAVVVDSLTYRIGKSTLLSDVSLTVPPGEILAVVGPNGAGKSTLLQVIAGAIRPSTGSAVIHGVDTSRAAPGEMALLRSVLGQDHPADIRMTAAQVVALGRFPHRSSRGLAKHDHHLIAAAMARTDTARLAPRTYASLSRGEQTSVSLARVIAQDTPVILLDEPTAALDVTHQERTMALIRELASVGKTMIVVLHDLNAAALHADRVLILAGGETAALGLPEEVLDADVLSEVYGHPMEVIDHPLRPGKLILAGSPVRPSVGDG